MTLNGVLTSSLVRLRARFEATRILASKVLADAVTRAANSAGPAECVGFSYKSLWGHRVPPLPMTGLIVGYKLEIEAGRHLEAGPPIGSCLVA
jgi:hypothetical protein